jgi:hypothetical protein
MHCHPQSEYDTAQRHARLASYFAKYGRDQKLPEMKFNGLIDTYSHILCHKTFLGVKVQLENFNVRAIAASSKTGHLRTVTKSAKLWTLTSHYVFTLYVAGTTHNTRFVTALKWNINSLIIKVYYLYRFSAPPMITKITQYIYIYIYICVCVYVCVYIYIYGLRPYRTIK